MRTRLTEAERYLRLDDKRARVAELEKEMGRADLWDDPDVGRAVSTEYNSLNSDVQLLEAIDGRLSDAETLTEMAIEEDDTSVEAELRTSAASIAKELDRLEILSLFAGEYDENDAVCEIHGGAGGTDAQDWAQMLLRMYQRWAERRGFGFEVDEVTEGQEAGILSATFIVKGRHAYGWLSSEQGTHRLVRISPFDSQARRQTSFALLQILAFLEDLTDEVDIDEKDLRIDTYRSSGAGGQHVNVTDSAVRITHLPTGIVVSSQNERSQHRNRDSAMKVLKSRLFDLKMKEQQAKLDQLGGEKKDIAFGSQIRSYVLHPYQLIKDHRTKEEVGDVSRVLDGDIDHFIKTYLMRKASGTLGQAV